MRHPDNRAIKCGRPLIFLLLLCSLGGSPLYAQRLFSVSVESKTVHDGKMSRIDKDIYYRKDGNLNIRYKSPSAEEYYSTTSPFGFTSFYYPATKETVSIGRDMFRADDELLYLFASGAGEDLGLTRFGFFQKSSSKDGKFTVKRYEPREKGGKCARVELVLDENYLPVYCAYYDKKGRIITKTYLSGYTATKDFVFPHRVTEISYLLERKDSTVRLDIYSKLSLDETDEMFDFHIPSDAVVVDMKEGQKAFAKPKL